MGADFTCDSCGSTACSPGFCVTNDTVDGVKFVVGVTTPVDPAEEAYEAAMCREYEMFGCFS